MGVVHSRDESVRLSDSKALVKTLGSRYEKMVFREKKIQLEEWVIL